MFFVTLIVTGVVEVPIVQKMDTWTASTLPYDWQLLRDCWGAFHLLRNVPAILVLVLLLVVQSSSWPTDGVTAPLPAFSGTP
jgi:hypothetical protein